jgi:cell division protein FtsI/penicillin-binding protein 2
MDLGLVNTFLLEKTLKTNNLPRKYINFNLIIFICFIFLLGFTLWYKYTQKNRKLEEIRINQDKLDKEFDKVMEIIVEEEQKRLIEEEEDNNEYIDLDGWAS